MDSWGAMLPMIKTGPICTSRPIDSLAGGDSACRNRYSHQSARILLAVHVCCPDGSISAPQSTIELRLAPFIRQQRRAGMNCTYSRESMVSRWPRAPYFAAMHLFCRINTLLVINCTLPRELHVFQVNKHLESLYCTYFIQRRPPGLCEARKMRNPHLMSPNSTKAEQRPSSW
jgi:hypothetical protein